MAQTENISNRPPMFALQVGISRYADKTKWAELAGSINDVEQMKTLLTGERYRIPIENIHTLLDEQATKKRIFDEFQNHLIKNAREYRERTGRRDAVAMFQFSGHGSQVPDTNGDEADGRDETFVTFDSRDAPGKNFDITDDEIYELTKQLSQYTDNIVYIFDSCHSGSGARDGGDARKIPARKTAPVPILKLPKLRGEARREIKSRDNDQTDLLPPSDDYIVISAAKSEQLAGQKYVFPDNRATEPIVYGFLSFYLIEELRNARANTTYRELMENVCRRVAADKPSQLPQLEGDGGRFVFGALGSREDNFVRILETADNSVTVKAGAMQGVTVGTVLAFYDKTDTDFAGSEQIASAKVSKVFADRSVADVIMPKRAITTQDKAVLVAPDLGELRLKVFLDADQNKLSLNEKNTLLTLRQKFTPAKGQAREARGVDLIEKPAKNQKIIFWDAAVLKDSFGQVFPAGDGSANNPGGKSIDGDRQIFYIAGKDFVPLYNFFVPTDDAQAAQKLEKALVHLARLRMVQAIANEQSNLKGKVAVKPVRLLNPKCSNNKITADKFETPGQNTSKTAYRFQTGEKFQFEIANNSKKELFIAMLGIGTDGSVKVHFPSSNLYEEKEGVKIAPGAKIIIPLGNCRVLATSAPFGLETFKLIASTEQLKPEDFKYLEMEAIGKERGEEKSLTGLGDWTTFETFFEITADSLK